MTEIVFIVPGKPRGKSRPRFAHGRAYTPQATHEYERLIAVCAIRAMRHTGYCRDGAKRLSVRACFPVPASWPKSRKAEAVTGDRVPETKPDADNILKAVADALNGIAYGDDCKVADMTCSKRYQRDRLTECPHGYLLVRVGDCDGTDY